MAKHDMMPAIPTTLGRAVEETRFGPTATLKTKLHHDRPEREFVIRAIRQRDKDTARRAMVAGRTNIDESPAYACAHAPGISIRCMATERCDHAAVPDCVLICASTREVRLQGLLAIAEVMAAFGEAGVWYGARDPSMAAANRIAERLSGIFGTMTSTATKDTTTGGGGR